MAGKETGPLFDLTAMPMLYLDAELRVTAANAAAEALLGRNPALRLVAGALRPRRDEEGQALRQALQQLQPPGKATVLLRSREGAPVMMIVLRKLAGGILATLAELDGVPAPDPGMLSDIFGLTGSEARVLVQIAVGEAPGDIAERLMLRPETVRGHLKAGMRKLGARTQAQAAGKVLRAAQAWQP